MKLFISLIILSFYFSNYICVNAQSSSDNDKFVNFEVYNDENCKNIANVNYGIGYSSVIDTCITLDYINNFIFKIQNDNSVEWSFYLNEGNVGNCNGQPIVKPSVHGINECLSSNVINFNSNHVANAKLFYYKLTTSSTPYAPINSFSTVYMQDDCSEDSILLVESFVNGTSVDIDNQGNTYSYYCSAYDRPYVEHCSPKCERIAVDIDICHTANAFFNSSSDSSNSCASGTISGSSITGCKGGMDTGDAIGVSSSGTHSGINSASSTGNTGSGSGTGSYIQKKGMDTGDGISVTSGTHSGKTSDVSSGGRTISDRTTGITEEGSTGGHPSGGNSGTSGSSGGSSTGSGGGGSGLVIHKNIDNKNTPLKDFYTTYVFAYQCNPSQH